MYDASAPTNEAFKSISDMGSSFRGAVSQVLTAAVTTQSDEARCIQLTAPRNDDPNPLILSEYQSADYSCALIYYNNSPTHIRNKLCRSNFSA